MLIKTFRVGEFGTNCYVVADEKTKECMLIDTGDVSDRLDTFIFEEKLSVKYIIFTHGHFDHIDGIEYYADKYDAEILIHPLDAEALTDTNSKLSLMMSGRKTPINPTRLVADGDLITFGECTFKVIHTPGHTLGGISLYGNGVLFSGDTLFYRSIGRTDFWGGDFSVLQKSILGLYNLPDDTVVYSGHGEPTTIGEEKIANPFVRAVK